MSADNTPGLNAIVKAYDVRGIVPEEFTTEIARALGAAFADVIASEGGAIALGHDMRESSPALTEAFGDGAAWRGVDVLHLGLCSTDGLYYVSGSREVPGAMFTASHNPAEYNGIKMCHAGARPVGRGAGLEEVQHRAEEYLEQGIPAAERQGEVSRLDTLADYAAHLRGLVNLSSSRPLKVVIDAGNGMAGLTAGAVLGSDAGLPDLGLEIVPMFFELDGSFPNHEANPLDPANLVDVQAAVIAEQADIGLAFDGDADRCFVIDERGVAVSPSTVTALVGLREVEKEKSAGRRATVIHNSIISRAVPELIEAAGGQAVRSRTGHSFMKERMAAEGAVFGGEHSAHYYFRDFWYADTGMLAAMHVLQTLGEGTTSVSDLAEIYTPYHSSGEINSRVGNAEAAVNRVREAFADDIEVGVVQADEFDGLTLSHWDAAPRWWFNLRASNTEPYLRLNVEAQDEDILTKITDGVLALVRDGQEEDDEYSHPR